MSYADAAKSLGPTGASKIPQPAKLEQHEASGHVEAIDGKEFDKVREKAKKATEEVVAEGKKQAKAVKKEIAELEKESKPYIDKAIAFVQEEYAYVSSYLSQVFSKETGNKVATELQNPVVIGQLALIAGGASAGWFVYAERARINTDNKYVLGIHAAIATALIAADAYVFQQLYPKYKKN